MIHHTRSFICALALLTTGFLTHAQESSTETPNTAMTAIDYVNTAASSDEFERQTGTLATQRAQNEDVREFGQHLVDDHTATSENLIAAATAAGVPAPTPTLHPGQQRMIDELTAAPAEVFDRLFLKIQAAAHVDAIALHSTWAKVGQEAPLRDVASATVPIVTGHLRHVHRLQHQIGQTAGE
jgi:putative membrane protein